MLYLETSNTIYITLNVLYSPAFFKNILIDWLIEWLIDWLIDWLYTIYIRINPVKWNYQTFITYMIKNTMTLNNVKKYIQSIWKTLVNNLLFGHVQILKTLLHSNKDIRKYSQFYTIILSCWIEKRREAYNSKSPLHNLFWQVSPTWTPPSP